MPKRVFELAYEGLTRQFQDQATALTNVRNRTVSLMSAAAVLVTFATGVGVINTDPVRGAVTPLWLSLSLMGSLICILGLVLFVLWPVRTGARGPNFEEVAAAAMPEDTDDDVYRHLIKELGEARTRSANGLYRRQQAQLVIIALLVVAVLLLVASVILQ